MRSLKDYFKSLDIDEKIEELKNQTIVLDRLRKLLVKACIVCDDLRQEEKVKGQGVAKYNMELSTNAYNKQLGAVKLLAKLL